MSPSPLSANGLPPRMAVVHNNDFQSKEVSSDSDEPPSLEADADIAHIAAEIAAILTSAGVEVSIVQVSDNTDELIPTLRDFGANAVFNLVESLGNDTAREPEVPLLLEAAHIPYTGNSPAPLRIAHAKDIAKQILHTHNIRHAMGITVFRLRDLPRKSALRLDFPLFVKPARTDTSIGIDQKSIVRNYEELRARVEFLLKYLPAPVLVEEYLPGRELNVAIFPDPYTGLIVPTEIDFSKYPEGLAPIVTYDCKWREDSPEYLAFSRPCAQWPDPELQREVLRTARAAFLALGGNGYGRVDMRLDALGHPAVIDINPNPDLDRAAGLSIAALSMGIDYPSLIHMIATRTTLKEHHVPAPYTTGRPRGINCSLGTN